MVSLIPWDQSAQSCRRPPTATSRRTRRPAAVVSRARAFVPEACGSCPNGVSLCCINEGIIDFLIELFRHRSHTFVAILTNKREWQIIFESRRNHLVFIEHDPERSMKSRCQHVLCHLRRDGHIADYILHGFRERICSQSPCVAMER
jgi:hypothetical protein